MVLGWGGGVKSWVLVVFWKKSWVVVFCLGRDGWEIGNGIVWDRKWW